MAPMDAIWLFLVLTYIALSHYSMAPISPTLHPNRSVSGIGYTKYLKWQTIQLYNYPLNSWCIDRL